MEPQCIGQNAEASTLMKCMCWSGGCTLIHITYVRGLNFDMHECYVFSSMPIP